jgi:hypothetical protein
LFSALLLALIPIARGRPVHEIALHLEFLNMRVLLKPLRERDGAVSRLRVSATLDDFGGGTISSWRLFMLGLPPLSMGSTNTHP